MKALFCKYLDALLFFINFLLLLEISLVPGAFLLLYFCRFRFNYHFEFCLFSMINFFYYFFVLVLMSLGYLRFNVLYSIVFFCHFLFCMTEQREFLFCFLRKQVFCKHVTCLGLFEINIFTSPVI